MPPSAGHGTASNKFDRFEAWLRENGAQFEQLELRSYVCANSESSSSPWGSTLNQKCKMDAESEEKKEPSGMATQTTVEESEMRGVHARVDLPPNTVCMTIPRRCLITVEMGQATEIGQAIYHSDLDLDAPKHIYLMIFILWDRKVNGSNSFFYPYYQILPPTLHNMPIFWKDHELQELTGSFLLQQIHDRNQAIIEDYNAICGVAPQMRSIATLQEFQWARMCVCSRNFGLCIQGHRTSALVPHADMLNHYRPRETKWTYDETIQAFTITTLQYINAGSEVLDSYGQKCNHRFLLNYGFAIEDNREMDGFCPNEVPIELKLSPTDPLFDEKIDFWIRGGGSTSDPPSTSDLSELSTLTREQISVVSLKRIRVCVTNNENTRLLWGLLRIMVSTSEDFRTIVSGGASALPSSSFTTSGLHSTGSSAVNSHRPRGTLWGGLTEDTSSRHRSSQPRYAGNASFSRSSAATSGLPNYNFSGSSPFRLDTTSSHRSCRDIRHPINLRNEREAMRCLRDIIQELLSRYPTTLQQDIDALANIVEYPKFSNRRHAKIQVKGEKEVLHHYLKWSQTAIDVINVIESELRDEVEQHRWTPFAAAPGIEVRWQGDPTPTVVDTTGNDDRRPPAPPTSSNTSSFDLILRRMEEDMHNNDMDEHHLDVHCTILRYCTDVLGNMRREEFRTLRRHLHPIPGKASPRNPINQDPRSRKGKDHL